MRFVTTGSVLFAVSLIYLCTPAAGLADNTVALAELQTRADQAQPRDRCFLYAQLVSRMTELAGQQFNSGDFGRASDTLKLVQRYADKIRSATADDSKNIKNAALLLEHTSYRLNEILRAAPYEARPALSETLKQLNQVQAQLMIQVFKK